MSPPSTDSGPENTEISRGEHKQLTEERLQAEVGVNTWVAHFNPSVFENPGAFKPERWDPEVVSKEKLKEMENSYMPFGLGTRTCIGKNISIMEMTKLIPQLVRRYDFDLLNPTGNQPVESSNNWFVKQKDVYMKVRSRPY